MTTQTKTVVTKLPLLLGRVPRLVADSAVAEGASWKGVLPSSRVLTFRPTDGTPSENIYTDFAVLCAVAAQSYEPTEIVFDPTGLGLNTVFGEACIIPAGTYDFGPLTTFRGLYEGGTNTFAQVVIEDGVNFTFAPIAYRDIIINVNATTGEGPINGDLPSNFVAVLDNAKFNMGAGAVPYFDIPIGNANTGFHLKLFGASDIGPGSIRHLSTPGNVQVSLWDNARIQSAAFNVTGTLTLNVNSSDCSPSITQTFGTLTPVYNTLDPLGVLSFSTTGSRPTVTKIGTRWFDTTLNKPIWWKGSAWVDATSTTV